MLSLDIFILMGTVCLISWVHFKLEVVDTLAFQKKRFAKSSLLLPKNSSENMVMIGNIILVFF